MAQEQVANFQAQLLQSQDHTARLSEALETLRSESSDAVAEVRRQLAAAEVKLHAMGTSTSNRKESLLDLKEFHPKIFAGKDSDNVKPWAKRVRSYCNGRKKGSTVALD